MYRTLLWGVLAVAPWAPLAAQGPSDRQPVSIAFRAMVGDQPFRCNTSYPGLGTSRAATTASEFRFYVHDLKLLRADGTTVPVELTRDSLWQDGQVALLDFESGEGSCGNGTKAERHEVTGLIPAGDYIAVSFVLGVPFARNHLDMPTQRAPLTLSRLYWSWSTGYKFLRIDLRSQRPDTAATVPWQIHLGSTVCTPKGNAPTECASPNRPVIALQEFSPDRDAIALDLAALVAGADLLGNQPQTAAGCMSGDEDQDCQPIFRALGLTAGGRSQTAFRVVRKAQP